MSILNNMKSDDKMVVCIESYDVIYENEANGKDKVPSGDSYNSLNKLIINDNKIDSSIVYHGNNHLTKPSFNRSTKGSLRRKQRDSISNRIRLNISGRVYQISRNTLEYFPNTLLGNTHDRSKYYDSARKEYFFERHTTCFESVLYFYQSRGRLYRPRDIPIDIFIDELEFFKFDKQIIYELLVRENLHLLPIAPDILPRNSCSRCIWLFFEHPTNLFSKCASAITAFLIVLSVVCACLESELTKSFNHISEYSNYSNNASSSYKSQRERSFYSDLFFGIESLCNLWFLLEFICRFASSPLKLKFLKNFLNLLDIFILITYLLMCMLILSELDAYPGVKVINVLRIFKLVRVIRLFKLTKYTKLLQVLVLTLRASLQAIVTLVVALMIGVVFFSSLLYYAESSNVETQFHSIPEAFWYTLNVMTTVGDSEEHPSTNHGKIVAGICAIAGVIIIAMPIPVIVSNFSKYYQVLVENTYSTYGRLTIQQRDDEPAVLQ